MPVIDLTQNPADGQGQLVKFSVKADGRDDSAFVYGLDIMFVIANTEEARVVACLLPGAEECYQRATERDNWKAQARVTPDIQGARVTMGSASESGTAIEGGAEVKAAILRASKRVVTLTVQLVMAGQTPQVASKLTGLLRGAVQLAVEGCQQALPFQKAKSVIVTMGGIAVARDEDSGQVLWGRVLDMDYEKNTATLDTFAEPVDVPQEGITSCWPLAPGEATEKAIKSFKAGCKKAKVTPTYRAVTLAVGEAYAGNAPADGQLVLTQEIVASAINYAKDMPPLTEVLPPEADDKAGEVVDLHAAPKLALA